MNKTVIHNTYVNNSFTRNVNANRTSFNGGNGGIKAEPNAEQRKAMANADKVGPTSQQLNRQQAAGKDKNLLASTNKGKPNQEAIKSFNKAEGAGQGKGAQGLETAGGAAGAGRGENKTGNVTERNLKGAGGGTAGEHRNKVGAENQVNKQRNVQASQAKMHSGKMAGPGGGAAHGPRTMNQGPHQTNMAAHGQQMGGKHPQMQMGGNRQPKGQQQQQGKKKPNKP